VHSRATDKKKGDKLDDFIPLQAIWES